MAQGVPLKTAKNYSICSKGPNKKSANARTQKRGLAPIMKTIRKYSKFSFKLPKRKKFNSLQELIMRTFFATENPVIPFFP